MKSISNCTQVDGKEIKGKVEVGDIFEKSVWGEAEPWTKTSERSKIIVTSVEANSFTVVMLDSSREYTIKYSKKNKYFFLSNNKSKIPSPFEFKVGDRIKDKDDERGIVQALFPDCMLILFPVLLGEGGGGGHALVTKEGVKKLGIKLDIDKEDVKAKAKARVDYMDEYFFVADVGIVSSALDWDNASDKFRFKVGNYYLTSAAAKKALKELKK